MKKLIYLSLFLLQSFFCVAQEPLYYTEVIDVNGVDKDELFLRGREWFNNFFKSSKDVLQVADKESGELLGKGIFTVSYSYKYLGERTADSDVNFTINIWVKDGKYKYEMKDLTVLSSQKSFSFGLITDSDVTDYKWPGVSSKKMNEIFLSMKNETKNKANKIINSLKSAMYNTSKSNNW